MRLSVVFELLLVFLFLAFAAARVIDPLKATNNLSKGNKKPTTLRQGPPNRYCACTSRMCNCCRDFSLPVVPLKGPGCASIMYVQRDTMMVTMSFGDRVLSNTTISGKTPKPICMTLPGGISQFCGRIYGINRKGDQFRACLGLELRALDDIEAALRVSCFKFGPKGVRLESAPPVPAESGTKDPEEEDEDDYDLDDDEDDDLIGFGVGDDDDDASSEDNEVDSDSVDYTGFSVLGEDILGTLFSDDTSSSSTKKKTPNKKTIKPQIVPKISTTTRRPIFPNRKKSTVRPITVTKRPLVNRITRKPIIQAVPSVPAPTTIASVVSKNITKIKQSTPETATTTITPTTTTTTTAKPPTTITTQAVTEMPTTAQTEQVITFTVPTVQTEKVKNEIKLPLTDLEKLEALAAIAQQDVSPGVISTSSLSSEETEKPEIITAKYDFTDNMEKINSVKFVPTTVVTSRPSAEYTDNSDERTDETRNTTPSEEVTEEINSSKIETNTVSNNISIGLKKQPLKENEEEEEEEEEEDLLEGVLSDDDDEEAEDNDSDSSAANKGEDDEDDVSGETEQASEEEKPPTVSIKKKPPKENDEEEEEEEEEDILDVLADDVEEEEDDEDDTEKPSKKKITTKKPEVSTVKPIEPATEKIIMYQKPTQQQTEKVIIYQQPDNKVPDRIFIYKEPDQKTTQKIIFYREPVTEKFVIVNEEQKPSGNVIVQDTRIASSEEEKIQSDSDESDEESSSEKQTLMASIIKPGFSNKYAEEHDLTENDDLEIEDSEDDDDFEEDRKLKQKKTSVKSETKKRPGVSKPKLLTLDDLIRQRKKYHEQRVDERPISTSRTHRRMNLDRLLQI